MELYVMFVFVAFLQLSSAFLMPDILANGTTPSVVSSSSESVEQRLHDLTTWLLEEKHIRYTLEQRLTQTENKVDIFDKFHELVTNELQTERDKINRLERNLAYANTTKDALVNDLNNANAKIDALEKDLKNATAKIVDLETALNIANAKIVALEKDNQSENDKVVHLEQNIANATSEIDSLIKDNQINNKRIQSLDRNLANATTEINALVKVNQDNSNMIQSLERNLNNVTSKINALEKDNYFEWGNVSRLEQNLANATSEISTLVNIISKLEYRFNDSTLEIDNLHNGIQQLNQTQLHSEYNRTSWNKDNMVAFSVDGPDNVHHNPQLFNNHWLELGDGYNSSTGKLVCHTPGVYVFMWTITQPLSGPYRICCLQINGSRYGQACALTGGGTGDYPSGSRSAIIRLNMNDKVELSCASGSHYYFSGFSGFLLYPEG